MKIPGYYYYSDSISSVQYTDEVKQEIEVTELLQNKPYWINPMSDIQKPKTLIITDWSARSWEGNKLIRITEYVEKLLENKFEIYFWQNGSFLQLKQSFSIYYGDTTNNVTFEVEDEIIKLAVKELKKTRAQLQLLTMSELEQQLSKNKITKNTFYLSHIQKLNFQELEKFKKIYLDSHAKIHVIVDCAPIKNKMDILKKNKNIEFETNIEELVLSNDNIITLNKENKITYHDGISFEAKSLGQITRLSIVDEIDIDQLNAILYQTTQLEYLDLSEVSGLNETPSNKLRNLPSLVSLDLSKSDVSSSNIDLFLEAYGNLHFLSINNINQPITLARQEYPQDKLFKLVFINVNIEADSFNRFLRKNANLRLLELALSTVNENNPLSEKLSPEQFTKLQSINLDGTLFDNDFFDALLKSSPNVSEFIYSPHEEQDAVLYNEEFYFKLLSYLKNLSRLSLNQWSFEKDELGNFLQGLKLEYLSLTNTEIPRNVFNALTSMTTLKEFYFNPLKDWEEKEGYGPLSSLQLYMDFCKKQKGLKNFTYVDNAITEDDIQLMLSKSDLEILYQKFDYGVHNGASHSAVILKKSKNLRKITLDLAKLTSPLSLEAESLPKVRELKIWHVDEASLSSLLMACKNLIKTEIRASTLHKPLHLEKFVCGTLEELSIQGEITGAALESLLMATPNLKKLDLADCKIKGSITLVKNSLSRLEDIDLHENNRGLDFLNAIRSAAPGIDLSQYEEELEDEDGLEDENDETYSDKVALDADTKLTNTTHSVVKLFKPLHENPDIHFGEHRLNVYHHAIVNENFCSEKDAFKLKKNDNLDLIECDVEQSSVLYHPRDENRSYYLGNQKLVLTSEWKALASISPREKMHLYNVHPSVPIQIQYSKTENLYYIKSLSSKSIKADVYFTLSIPKKTPLPNSIASHVNYFRSFGSGELKMDKPQMAKGSDYLTAIVNQKKGACRHRAFAFKKIMERYLPTSHCRIVTNHCHAFVELYINNEWVTCHLGGYPAQLKITNQPQNATPVDLQFNSDSLYSYQPSSKPFVFTGLNNTLNHDMIIEKFSQFLLLSNDPDISMIPKIQKGICKALVHLYFNLDTRAFNQLLIDVRNWDGNPTSLKNVKAYFILLKQYVSYHYFTTHKQTLYFVGDALQIFLDGLPQKRDFHLVNTSHAVALRRIRPDLYEVYDSNFVNGPKQVNLGNLLSQIKFSLGEIILVDVGDSLFPDVKPKIVPNRFMDNGGLLILAHAKNSVDLIKQIIPSEIKHPENGLFSYDSNGKPAWFHGLLSPSTKELTKTLLDLYLANHPDEAKNKIVDSMEYLGEELKLKMKIIVDQIFMKYDILDLDAYFTYEYKTNEENVKRELERIEEEKKQEAILVEENAQLQRQTANKYYDQFKTWEIQSTQPDLEKMVSEVLSSKHLNQLIEFESKEDLIGFFFEIEKSAETRPVLYIDKPEKLRCRGNFIVRGHDNVGTIVRDEGGRLQQFIKQHQDKTAILIINYDQFKVDDIVKYNSLLYKARSADGHDIPKTFLIVGLLNINSPDCYQGSDFYSRFQSVKRCNVSAEFSIPVIPFAAKMPNHSALCLKLFYRPDWKNFLLGHWIMEGSQFQFKKGALSQLFGDSESKAKVMQDEITILEVQGGLWGNPEFDFFWQQAIQNGFIENEGIKITLPTKLQIVPVDDYEWATLKTSVKPSESKDAFFHILNVSTLNQFFAHQAYDDTKHSLIHKLGIIESSQTNEIEVTITSSISSHQWARLLDECKRVNKLLRLRVAPHVVLPPTLSFESKAVCTKSAIAFPYVSNLSLIESNDIDFTIHQLNQKNDFIVIDISECRTHDLFERLNTHFNAKTNSYEFNQSTSWLLDALQKGNNLLLKGTFSQEMIDKFASALLTSTSQWKLKGKLCLVTQPTTAFDFVQCDHVTHTVSDQDKLNCIHEAVKGSLISFASEPFAKLQARERYQKVHPTGDSQENWQGLHSISVSSHDLKPLNITTAEKESIAFLKSRLDKIQHVFTYSPYVFLAGLSGVGKSTFVTDYLSQHVTVYNNESKLIDWLTDKNNAMKILFIDEANLNPSDWTLFEGLFNKLPGILYQGNYYPISRNHKVIFAGNPLSYGDERRLASLFERYGHSVVFDPLPTALLYEKVLKPLLMSLPDKDIEKVAKHFLEVYRHLLAYSNKDVLISPRELEMMALLTVTHYKNNPQLDLLVIAEHFAYTLAEPQVPELYKKDFADIFLPKLPLYRLPQQMNPKAEFVVTPSREKIFHYLKDLLALREARRKQGEEKVVSSYLYGGLGGVILEGEPGIGKSELVLHTLKSEGYIDVDELKKEEKIPDKIYMKIPVSLSVSEKEAMLFKAFDMGAVVIMDEINSAPMMERTLNALLMGRTPEGKRPNSPGFFIIGTQNPVTMAGRRAQSTALSRRMLTMTLSDYPKEELELLIAQIGVPKSEREELLTAFIARRQEAISLGLTNALTFRHLERIAKNSSMPPLLSTSQDALFARKRKVGQLTLDEQVRLANDYERPTKKIKLQSI